VTTGRRVEGPVPFPEPGVVENVADVIAERGVDEGPANSNQRDPSGVFGWIIAGAAFLYAVFHLVALNIYPIETWTYRMLHVLGVLVLGFMVAAPHAVRSGERRAGVERVALGVGLVAALLVGYAAVPIALHVLAADPKAQLAGDWEVWGFGVPLAAGTALALVGSWTLRVRGERIHPCDVALILAALVSSGYLLAALDGAALRMRAGTPFAAKANVYAAIVGIVLIFEVTRRVAGLALVVIAAVFCGYAFLGPWLPGFLAHAGYSVNRFATYVYTDNGILGATTAVSSTYIILFIIFGAFLQVSKVGEYFVNLAFAIAGRARGGPAKVAVFASGLMGMINGTSAGNVVATGSLTIPLMKKVGYPAKTAGAVEAAASTGGQIMPPIMGAGAFIMAEVTGIAYTDIAIAAIIPALLYFLSVLFMVDLAAAKLGMKGMRPEELPQFRKLILMIHLLIPIVILIGALFMNYSVIRAGTLATVAAVVVSWLSAHRMGPLGIAKALSLSGIMSIQIIAVCACAGVIVGVIALTGVGARFSSLLLGIANGVTFMDGRLLALVFSMLISLVLGMGMPTTAAYAIVASVVAPGLIDMGIEPLVAHFFVFYFAVVSAITPPVALAGYAAAAVARSGPMETSVASFFMGLAAFIVPFMFFYSPALLMQGEWWVVAQSTVTALVGVYFLAAGLQGWFFGRVHLVLRAVLVAAALLMIDGGIVTDLAGLGLAAAVFAARSLTGGGRARVAAE
jgi:TRAP transporter 4TM/12TM fusion protein